MLRFAVLLACLLPSAAWADTGHWVLVLDRWGSRSYDALSLNDEAGQLTGKLGGDPLSGTRAGKHLAFKVVSGKETYLYEGMLDEDTNGGAAMQGSADFPDTNNPQARARHGFTARKVASRQPGPARVHDFAPIDYANEFSPHRLPVLTVWPGDTVRTKTLDSGGVDEHGVTRALYGNPQTGPFYIDGAEPGDTLVVHLGKVRLNRDYADSLDALVGRAMSNALAAKASQLGQAVRWKLDRARGLASPLNPGKAMAKVVLPVRPMLGGLAVAPGNGSPPISTGDTGRFGGNMDFNEVVEGNTVYLPVQQPGALLYLGDAHALQGDGETSQYALETSMDVEFTVDVIKGASIAAPRVESPTQIMTLGQAGSLDEALRLGASAMVDWLVRDYGLTVSESAQVLGSAVKINVANLAGRSVGVAVRIDKAWLGPRQAPAPMSAAAVK